MEAGEGSGLSAEGRIYWFVPSECSDERQWLCAALYTRRRGFGLGRLEGEVLWVRSAS
jgi:hypothetical protein